MATTNIERRYCRVEDWEGNIYYFSSQSGASSGIYRRWREML